MESFEGKVLGNRYEVTEMLGEGGMAVVYKAFDAVENRVVAVKILKEEFLANEEFSRRFKNEAKAIAILSHPNIVKVYDIFFSDKLQYIVMEYIEGITLKEYINQQKIVDWKEAVHFTTQILRALQHAHDKGIVHRDIKPQNIMVLQNGNIKVADFGIARFSRSETRTITENGAIGSVHYISPEQARGELTDAQADIYSVGVVLYEMITGRLPFDSKSAVSVALMQVQSEPVRPRDINPMIPIGLEQITLRAMQKEKANRYRTASEMLIDLDEFKRTPAIKFDYPFATVSAREAVFVNKSAAADIRIRDGYGREPGYRRPPVQPGTVYDRAPQKPEPEEEEPAKSAALPILIGVFSALVVGIILIAIFVLPGRGGKTIDMPELVGKKYEDVIKEYDELSFAPPVYVYNPDYADGYVCEQSIKTGTKIKKSTVITLSVSSDEGTPVVSVVGYQYSEASSILKSYGFSVKVVPEKSATVKEGEVIRTAPAANEVAQYGATITLYVATKDENAPVAVPDLTGKTRAQAEQALEDLGLKLGAVSEQFGTAENQGYIIGQEPQADAQVKPGSEVAIIVSKGAEQDTTVTVAVKLPTGSGSATADAYLNNTKVREITVSLDGSTVRMDFTGRGKENRFTVYIDAFLLCDGTIDFTADPPTYEISMDNSASYTEKKAVPDVVRLSLSNARQLLEGEGFTNIKVLEQETDGYTPGMVISQSPSHSATTYSLDREITLIVARSVSADPWQNEPDD
ncbi:MAG: Stk1 family PASTA domain-containing Ser/Thr kinase [Clostridia bacterium]|nr:Stk1 family PASTA domain-containing Ser/Thr kinase [Clostridia bacterium]